MVGLAFMWVRAGSILIAITALSGCAELQGLRDFAMAPANQPASHDPTFRVNELRPGMTTPQLQAKYGNRLVRDGGGRGFDLYVVEPVTATPGSAMRRERLALWVTDGKLGTWGLVEANGTVAGGLPPPDALPPAPGRARVAG